MEKNQPKVQDDYDPHDHRNISKPTTDFQAFVNFLKASIGTGVLAMPLAFANAGYAAGLFLMISIGIICLHALHILISSMYELCKRRRVPYLTYSEAMKAGFEDGPRVFKCFLPISVPMVDFFLGFYHFGSCSVYIIFIAESVKQIVDEYFQMSLRLYMCIIMVPIFFVFCIRSLKVLAYFSTCANILLLIGFGSLLYYIFTDLPPFSNGKYFADISTMPIFFGTSLFALESVGVVLAIEESMKTPKDYVRPFGVMNIGMTIVVVLYTAIGFFGYWKYGENVLGSITLNIPQDNVWAQCIKILFAITIVVSYALNGFVVVRIVWYKYLMKRVNDESKHFLYEELIRAAILLLTLVFAIAIPNLGMFLSLVGAFSLSFLCFIFPAILQMCVHYTMGYGPLKIRLIKNLLLMAFGIFGGAVGTAVSISEIVKHSSEYQ